MDRIINGVKFPFRTKKLASGVVKTALEAGRKAGLEARLIEETTKAVVNNLKCQ